MAIRRHSDATSNASDNDATHAPSSSSQQDYSEDYKTSDFKQVREQYQSEAESKKTDQIHTGALLPRDMTVKLVRAEAANWETFIQCLYSITLTLFGLFLGSWISTNNTESDFTKLEVVATIAFGVISIGLIITWVTIKVKQSKQGIKIPNEALSQYSKSGEGNA